MSDSQSLLLLKPVSESLKTANLHPCFHQLCYSNFHFYSPLSWCSASFHYLCWKEKKNPLEPLLLAERIKLRSKNPYIVFSLIILDQIKSESINHWERHNCCWGEMLLNFAQKKQLHLGGLIAVMMHNLHLQTPKHFLCFMTAITTPRLWRWPRLWKVLYLFQFLFIPE